MKLQEKEASAYEAEHQNIAGRLMREMPPFKEAEQLLELVQAHFSLTLRRTQRSKVIVLGLMSGLGELAQDALILLPIVSDSTRKLAYLLRREGLKVHTLDIPPVKNESALSKYERQLELCAEAISAHTGKRLTRRSLRNAAGPLADADLLQLLLRQRPPVMDGTACPLE